MIQIFLPHKQEAHSARQAVVVKRGATAWNFLLSWEIYLILFITAFLRLFNIDKVMFGDDEAGVFRLAHDAVTSGLLPLTSNQEFSQYQF